MKFALGDHVRITAQSCRYFDYVGTVGDVNHTQHFPFGVTGLEDWPLWFGPGEMVLAEAPMQEVQRGTVGAAGAVVAPVDVGEKVGREQARSGGWA